MLGGMLCNTLDEEARDSREREREKDLLKDSQYIYIECVYNMLQNEASSSSSSSSFEISIKKRRRHTAMYLWTGVSKARIC